MAFISIALGSNLGQRDWYLDRALERLRALPKLTLRAVSSYYQTAPVDSPEGSGAYLNAVTTGETSLTPQELLESLLLIEKEFGRQRGLQNAPRTLDLDLLFYDQLVSSGEPILPHPRMHLRHFVLIPLNEIAPDWVHPQLNKTIAILTRELPPIADPPKLFHKPVGQSLTLKGKKALVTGSTSGIGRAIALELASQGCNVIVHGRVSRQEGERLLRTIRGYGSEGELILADLADPKERLELAERAWQRWGSLDILVNNAGVDLLTKEAKDWDYARKWQALIDVDINATVFLSRWIGQKMKSSSGVILNIGWDQAETGMSGENPELFSMAKAAVMAFSRSLSLSLAPTVRVNCLALGWIKTAWGEQASDVWQQRVKEETPLQRWGLPEEVARFVAALCGDAGAFITGQTLRINGGVIR